MQTVYGLSFTWKYITEELLVYFPAQVKQITGVPAKVRELLNYKKREVEAANRNASLSAQERANMLRKQFLLKLRLPSRRMEDKLVDHPTREGKKKKVRNYAWAVYKITSLYFPALLLNFELNWRNLYSLVKNQVKGHREGDVRDKTTGILPITLFTLNYPWGWNKAEWDRRTWDENELSTCPKHVRYVFKCILKKSYQRNRNSCYSWHRF